MKENSLFDLNNENIFIKRETYKSYMIFHNEKYNDIRVVYRNNKWMFIASDICEGLKYARISSLLEKIDESQKAIIDFYENDEFEKPQFFHAVTFDGLCSMAEQSAKKDSVNFVAYVQNEILPSLKESEEKKEEIFSFQNNTIIWVDSLKDIQFYKNKKFDHIRFTQYDDEILFVAKDVAEAVGHANANRAIYNHCIDIRYACVQTSSVTSEPNKKFLKVENPEMLPENFYPDTSSNDKIIIEDESFTSPIEIRGLKLITIQDVCRLISRSRMELANILLDSIVSEFISKSFITLSSPSDISGITHVSDKEITEKQDTEDLHSLTENETATAWRLIENYLRSKSQIDREILLTYDRGMKTLKKQSPIQLFGINIEETKKERKKATAKIAKLSDIDILPYIEDMFEEDLIGFTFVYDRVLNNKDGQKICCFDELVRRVKKEHGVEIKVTRNIVTRYLKKIGFIQTHSKIGNGLTIYKNSYEKLKTKAA